VGIDFREVQAGARMPMRGNLLFSSPEAPKPVRF
jgi:hypothetical protein